MSREIYDYAQQRIEGLTVLAQRPHVVWQPAMICFMVDILIAGRPHKVYERAAQELSRQFAPTLFTTNAVKGKFENVLKRKSEEKLAALGLSRTQIGYVKRKTK